MTYKSDDEVENLLRAEEAAEILESSLTEADLERLTGVKHELGICIKWGSLISEILPLLVKHMDAVVFLDHGEKSELVKRNPYEALFPADQDLINGPTEKAKLARQYVLTLLVKKLLGGLKTRLNQGLQDLSVISAEEAKNLLDLILQEDEQDKEEPVEEQEIVARIEPAGRSVCKHIRTTYRQMPASRTESGKDEMQQYCKRCHRVLKTTPLPARILGEKKPRKCPHRNGYWKKGEEGRTAICSDCNEVVPDPNKFEWSRAGLEPVGDNPEEDELHHFVCGGQEEVQQ
jgi:hypothetical protein